MMRHWLNDTNRAELAECFNCSPSEVEARLDEQKAKASAVPSHWNNPVTHEDAAERYLLRANDDLRRSVRPERRVRFERSAADNFGFAAFHLERANLLRGNASFSLLPNRDRSIDEAFARYEADESRLPAARAAA